MSEHDEIIELMRQVSLRNILIEKVKVDITKAWLRALNSGDTQLAQNLMDLIGNIDEEINAI